MDSKRKRPTVDRLLDQLPPHSLDTEKAVLGSIILDPRTIDGVAAILAPMDFYADAHRKLFGHLLAMHRDGIPIDVALLVERLKQHGDFEAVGESLYVAEVVQAVPTSINAAHYASVVREKAQRRMAIEAAANLLRDAGNGRAIGDVLRDAIGQLDVIATGAPSTRALQPALLNLADVQPEPIRWLWDGRIALGKVTLLVGDPGEGKSFLALDIASRVTRGAKWPDDTGDAPLGSVVILSGEDGVADTIVPRLMAAEADRSRVHVLQGAVWSDEEGDHERDVDLQHDLDIVEAAIQQTPDCRLLIIDPIGAYLGDTDSHNNSEVRRVLKPIANLAAKYGVAILCIHHFRKSEGAAKHRVTGSLAFTAAARAVWALTTDNNDPEKRRRLLVCVKNNLGIDNSGLAFELSSRYSDGVPSLNWEAGAVTIAADEALAPKKQQPGPDADDRHEAEAFLVATLTDGPRLSKDIEEEAREARGISKRTLDRAKKNLGIEAFREKIPGPWSWRLSNTATPF